MSKEVDLEESYVDVINAKDKLNNSLDMTQDEMLVQIKKLMKVKTEEISINNENVGNNNEITITEEIKEIEMIKKKGSTKNSNTKKKKYPYKYGIY